MLVQVLQGCHQPPGHLWRACTGDADLIEGEVHVRVPVHLRNGQPELSAPVAVAPIGQFTHRQLTQPVMEPIDGLHRSGRVEER